MWPSGDTIGIELSWDWAMKRGIRMAAQLPDVERQWAAQKRDFVADRHVELAGERDAAGDMRDMTASLGGQPVVTIWRVGHPDQDALSTA